MTSAQLIALDWGSTSLRAYLMGAGGVVLQQRSSEAGASRISGGAPAFEAALRTLVGDWLQAGAGLPVFACGMVGSAHGWLEAPYAHSPVAVADLHAQAVCVQAGGGLRVHIVPGVLHRSPGVAPDVMRGEETQVAGLLAAGPAWAERACVLLPGTHSKWVQLRQGRIESFGTHMTGELFAVLREHSVLGRLMQASPAFDAAAFDRGVQTARRTQGAGLTGQLFSVRTLGLTGEVQATGLSDYLSGLLIGSEIASALPALGRAPTLVLAGEAALCERYQQALAAWGLVAARPRNHAAAADGLWFLAHQAGALSG